VRCLKVELEVTLPSEGRDRTFKVAIKFIAQASLYALEEALDGRSQVVPADAVQALDVVMRHLPSMRYSKLFVSVLAGVPAVLKFLKLQSCPEI